MSRRTRPADQWVATTRRRKYARVAGRLEAVLDILDHTDIPDRTQAARAKHRAAAALEQALRLI